MPCSFARSPAGHPVQPGDAGTEAAGGIRGWSPGFALQSPRTTPPRKATLRTRTIRPRCAPPLTIAGGSPTLHGEEPN